MKRQTRKETREKLEQHNLACDLHKIISHFFPQLIRKLKEVKDPRNQSYITYESQIIIDGTKLQNKEERLSDQCLTGTHLI